MVNANKEATCASFSVIDLTRPGFEPPTFHTERKGVEVKGDVISSN